MIQMQRTLLFLLIARVSHRMQNKPERSNSLRLVQKQFKYEPYEVYFPQNNIQRSKSLKNVKHVPSLDFDQVQNSSKPKTIAYKPSSNIRPETSGPNIDYHGIGKHAEYGMFGFKIKNMRYTDYKKLSTRQNDHFTSMQKKEVFKHNAISKMILKFNKKVPKENKLVSKTKCCAYFVGKNPVTKEEFAEALKTQKYHIAEVPMIQQCKLDLRIQAAQERSDQSKEQIDRQDTKKIISESVQIQNTMSEPKLIHQVTQEEYYIEDFKVVENYFVLLSKIMNQKLHDSILFKFIYHPYGEPIIKYQFLSLASEIENYKEIIKNAIVYQPVFEKLPEYKNKKLNVLRYQFMSKPFVQKQLCRREHVNRYFIYNNKVVSYDRFNQLCLYESPKMLTQNQYNSINDRYQNKSIDLEQGVNYVINDIFMTAQTFNQAVIEINNQYNCKLLYKIIENDPEKEYINKYYIAGPVASLEGFRFLKHEVDLSKIEVTPDDELQYANLSLLSFCTPESQKAFLRQVKTDSYKNVAKLRGDSSNSRSKTVREQRKLILEIKEKRYRQQQEREGLKPYSQAANFFKRPTTTHDNEEMEIKFNVVEK